MAAQEKSYKEKVLAVLNQARAMELQAISQYMNQHYVIDDMDYGELAGNIKLIAIDEMRHAEDLAERIKELGGDPTTDLADKVVREQSVEKAFAFDVNLEDDTIVRYNEFLKVCREAGDSTSGKLFERLIDEEQEHLNYFDDISEHINSLGNAYLARIAGTPSSTGAGMKGFVTTGGGEA